MASNTPTRLPTAERRAQILEAARQEFLARGFSGGRVQDVADRAGVTIALVYKHFGSKEQLFEGAVMAPLHDQLAQRIEQIKALPADPAGRAQLETTRDFMHTLLATFTESIEAIGVVLFGDRNHAKVFYATHVRPVVDAAVEASEATMATWPHRDYDVRTAMNAAFGMAFWHAMDRSLSDTTENIEPIADQLADILFNGLRAPAVAPTDSEPA
jgi:AcrR family transcriptional regulator